MLGSQVLQPSHGHSHDTRARVFDLDHEVPTIRQFPVPALMAKKEEKRQVSESTKTHLLKNMGCPRNKILSLGYVDAHTPDI